MAVVSQALLDNLRGSDTAYAALLARWDARINRDRTNPNDPPEPDPLDDPVDKEPQTP